MHIAVRSTVATGVAMVGATAVALSPIQPLGSVALPEINVPAAVSTAAIELAALPNPIAPWVDVLTEAVANASVLGSALLADPLPIARQAALNWIGYGQTTATALSGVAQAAFDYFTTSFPQALNTAFQQLRDGQPAAAASTLSDAVIGILVNVGYPAFTIVAIPGQITDNLTAAVHAVTDINTLLSLVIGVAGPVGGVIRSVGDNAQLFVDAVATKDYGAATQALFNVVPDVVTAIVNGYTTLDGSLYPGLLTPPNSTPFNTGLAYSLLVTIPRAIATAIGATAPSSAASRVAKSAESADTTPSMGTGTSARSSVGGSQASGQPSAKFAGAKKSTGAKSSTDAKSARPHAGSGRHGGSAAG